MRRSATGLEVVLMQRFKFDRGEYWVVPGGGVEHGESPRQAAQRELVEETGLEFTLTRKLYESVSLHSKRVAHYWIADFISGTPHLLETSPEILERHGVNNRCAALGQVRRCGHLAAVPVCDPSALSARLARGGKRMRAASGN